MSRRDFLTEIAQRRARNSGSPRISAFSARHEAIKDGFMRLLKLADQNGTTFDPELCRYFPIALVAAVEGYFRQAIADLTNIGNPYRSRVQDIVSRSPKSEIATAVTSGEVTLGDWYAHITSFGNLAEVDRVLTAILGFPFLERLLTSDFEGIFGEGDEFHLREVQEDVIDAAKELFQTRHVLCHEFASAVKPDIAAVMRIITVADLLVSLSDVIIFAEAEQRK